MEGFQTSVAGIVGVWPDKPSTWSYSSLREAEECPRRWALRRARYPDLWGRPGYPPAPILPAIIGTVIHRALETIVKELHVRGCATTSSPSAIAVMRELGGFTEILKTAIGEEYDRLETNPRARDRVATLRATTTGRLPEMRERVQAILSRTELQGTGSAHEGAEPRRASGSGRPGFRLGSHPEAELFDSELGFVGKADLLTVTHEGVEIVDYKTGEGDERHVDQIKLYALLWERDGTANPRQLPVQKLVLAYANSDREVEVPSPEQLKDAATELGRRIAESERNLESIPPPARPSTENCRLCAVRHICDEFWLEPPDDLVVNAYTQPGEFVDAELRIDRQNGPRSWVVTLSGSTEALLRTQSEHVKLLPGAVHRLTGLSFNNDDDAGLKILSATSSTEIYELNQEL